MDAFGGANAFWDISQQPTSFSQIPDDDFLALLQKQFPSTVGATQNIFDVQPDGVNPQNVGPFALPNPSPPSTDSSPSPPSVNQEPAASSSRRQSGAYTQSPTNAEQSDDPTLKRKASDDSMSEEPNAKNAHTDSSSKKNGSGSSLRRKSTGNPHQDESRLLKRKEQNRAAQRAFRERKEKHVKDLEDKVAALEAKNTAAESENDNLRDLLSRLQSENMALKQAAFTFSVPKTNGATAATSNTFTPARTNGSFFGHPSTAAPKSPEPSLPPSFDFNMNNLIPFDPSVLNQLDESAPPATDGTMNMDFFNQPSVGPYKTIASNPMFMSFAEPSPYDFMGLHQPIHNNGSPPNHTSNPANNMEALGLTPFDSWSQPNENGTNTLDSFDQLFGGNFAGGQTPVDISALLSSTPSSLSPVSHHASRTTSNATTSSSSNNSPHGSTSESPASSASTPPSNSATPVTPNPGSNHHNSGQCPRTKEDMQKAIQTQGESAFTASSNPSGNVRKDQDALGPMVICKGSSFPKTTKSDKNIEVLAAWRSITSNPQYKDLDINDLCSEFTSKARCDGTKVVLEPEGVNGIMEALAAKRQVKQQGQTTSQ